MNLDISSNLLKKLCCHVSGLTGGAALEQYQLAVTLLNDNLVTEPLKDCGSISDNIKRMLVHESRPHDAARFSFLLSKLHRSSVLRNKAAILQLFTCLRHQNSSSSSTSENSASALLPHEPPGGLTNGHGPFRAPSLHSSTSRGSSESFPSTNSAGASSQDVESVRGVGMKEGGSGRVARLAAMYKVDGSAITPEEKQSSGTSSKAAAVSKPTNQHSTKSNTKKEWATRCDVSEEALIREILFAFQGIEGKFIKMDIAKDCFTLDEKVRLSIGKRDLVMKLIEIGWLYSKVQKFCEAHGRSIAEGNLRHGNQDGNSLLEVNGAGLVNQSLVLAIKEELNEYCRLIAVLESQIHENDGTESPYGDSAGGLTLRKLLMWTLEPRCRLRTLALITHAVRETKGGASAAAIYQHLHHGDGAHVQIVRRALSQACRPLFVMLTDWLLDGSLKDPHHEFFIAADPSVPNERLWHDKYDIRWCMLPSFINENQAQKVLATGKSLNFLRNVCNFKSPIGGREAIKTAVNKTTVESLFNQNETNHLEDLITLTFRSTSSHVLEELLNRHKLVEHLTALKRYLLLGQGDFIHYLMEIIEPELCKPANTLHAHSLSFILETAIAGSNAQHEEPDILKRLDVRLLQTSTGETGWEVFSLNYHVDGPIGTVFTAECMGQYLMLFNSLWKAKHMERILSATWKQQAATSKLCRSLPELGFALHRIQLLLTEMIHLVQQMAYYMTFEVLECSWHALLSQLATAQSLDDVLGAHAQFLKRIVAGALLDEDSRDVRTHLLTLYSQMLQLERLQERLYNAVVGEVGARRAAQIAIEERTRAGQFGTSSEMEENEQARKDEFSNKFVPSFRSDLKVLTQSYQEMVQSFLLMLSQHEDENLHLLSTRLDFSEHYQRRDHRLNMRLTYLHKRMSMGASFCQ